MNILVSACLLGIPCTYSGRHNYNDNVFCLKTKYTLIPVCPEQLGGLPTPRPPAEIHKEHVITKDGSIFTQQFKQGAESVLQLAKILDCSIAILKSNSPSCGNCQIYDGSFTKTLIQGSGITAQLLMDHGIAVLSELDIVPTK